MPRTKRQIQTLSIDKIVYNKIKILLKGSKIIEFRLGICSICLKNE